MKISRSQIIWISGDGSGRIHIFRIAPFLIRIFFFMVFLSICAVPVLETGLFNLIERIYTLEHRGEELHTENISLQYLKKRLVSIEEKEKSLKEYFGVDGYRSLEQVVGSGGSHNIKFSKIDTGHNALEIKHFRRLISSENDLPKKLQLLDSNYKILNSLSLKKEERWEYTPNIVPVDLKNPRVSSGFGWRKSPWTGKREFHAGIDIIGLKGTKIIAPAAGVVVNRGYDRWIGNYLVLKHIEGKTTIYGHLNSISVKIGALVKRGEQIGEMGNTGLSTGTHLHYTVLENNRAVNPMQYILDM